MTRFARARGLASTIATLALGGALGCATALAETQPDAVSGLELRGHILSDPLVDVTTAGRNANALFAVAQSEFINGKYRRARQLLRGLVVRFPDSPEAAEARRMLRRILATLVSQAQRSNLGGGQQPAGASKLGGAAVPVMTGWNVQVTKGPTAQDALALSAGDRVFFEAGSTTLGDNARRVLSAQAKWLKEHPNFGLIITGHADEPGSLADNVVLSVERAKAVRSQLVQDGVAKERLRVAGFGNVRRVAVCAFSACQAQNRRAVSKVLHWSRHKGLHQLSSR
jgi:peptidoglycan-associated lipoprotein